MSEWKEIAVGDLCTISRGGSPRPIQDFIQDSGTPWVKIADAKADGRYIYKTKEFIKPEGETKSRVVFPGDFILSNSATPGLPRFMKIRACIHDGWLLLRDFVDEIDQMFLHYLLVKEREALLIQGNGSIFTNLKTNILREHKVLIPPLEEQRAIASVLSSLDDKRDLLHRQNQTLEQMAETLFRQWFVEEADDDWEFTSLENFVTCFNGVSYKSADLNPSDIAMITLKSFSRDGGFRLDGFKEYTGKYKEQHIVNEGDLVVAHTDITQDAALIGNPIMVIGRREYKTLLISMDLVKVVSNYQWLSKEFLYYQMKSRDFKQHCLGYSNGSTVLHLSKQAVPSYEFFLPPKELIADFTNQVKPLIEKSNKNIKHIRNLEEIRDTLLPKLMSGEVKAG